MKWKVTLLLVVVSIATSAANAEWPKRFLDINESEHTVVVLYEDGSAAYSTRIKRQGHADAIFVASQARWEWCKVPMGNLSKRCLSLHVDGMQSGQQVGFRFDYYYEESKLTEFDKMGVQAILKRNDKD
jgi:hypothetical protein